MSETAEEIIVTVEDTPLPGAAEATPPASPAAAPPPAPTSDDPKEGMEDLKRQLAAEKERADNEARARAEAERRATQAGGEARQFRTLAERNAYDSVVNSLAAKEQESAQMKADYKRHMEEGEFDKAAEITEKLGELGADLRDLKRGKSEMEASRDNGAGRAVAGAPPDWNASWTPDQLEQYAATRTTTTAAWIRANPRFASDPAFRHKVAAADSYATQLKGLQRDTPEYFRLVEEQVGLRTPESGDAALSSAARVEERATPGVTPAASPPPATRPAAAARPAASPPGSAPLRPTQVVLTRDEYDSAWQLFPQAKSADEARELQAQYKLALIRAGDKRVIQ